MKQISLLCLLLFLLSCTNKSSQKEAPNTGTSTAHSIPNDSLRNSISAFLQNKKATVGMAFKNLQTGDTFSYNGDVHFPLMSVAKFPESLMLLSQVDRGERRLDAPVSYERDDLKIFTKSSFRKDHPGERVSIPLLETIRYAMGQSDNISANKMFQILGGPQRVEDYLHRMGITDMGLSTDYAHMKPDSPLQNWGTPRALVELLEKFEEGKILSDSNTALLYKLMVESISGADRLKAGLPAGTVIAHKTGTSGRNAAGVTAAFNDVGIVELPDGNRYAIAVFIGDSGESDSVNAGMARDVSRMVWERYSRQ